MRARGFTLIELMITLALGAVLIMAAAPSFTAYIANQRVKSGALELYTSLLYARSEAIKRNGPVYLVPGAQWHEGWAVTSVAGKSYAECLADASGCLKIQGALPSVAISSGSGALTFERTGRVTASSSPTFSLCDAAGSPTVHKRIVSLDLTGQALIRHAGSCP